MSASTTRLRPTDVDLGESPADRPRNGTFPKIDVRWVVGAVAAGLLLVGCSGGGAGQLVEDGGPRTNVVEVAPADRSPAPEIAGTSLADEPVDVAEHRGKVVVLNFWAEWCGPCRDEMPALVEAANTYDPAAVQFLGVNTKDRVDSARAMERSFDVPYPSIYDHDGEIQLRLRGSVPPQSMPSTVFLDPEGRVAATVVGKVTHSSLTRLVDELLVESGLAPEPTDTETDADNDADTEAAPAVSARG